MAENDQISEAKLEWGRSPSSRHAVRHNIWSVLWIGLVLLLLADHRVYCQIPAIALNGQLYPFQNSTPPLDLYAGQLYVDQTGGLYDDYGNYFGPSFDYSQGGWGGAFAVDSYGLGIWGVPNGILVYSQTVNDLLQYNGVTNYFTEGEGGAVVAPFYNGSAYVGKFFTGATTYFNVGSSPWYWYNGNGDFVVDGRNGWPASNIFSAQPPPTVYVNGFAYDLTTTTSYGWVSGYHEIFYYKSSSAGGYVNIERYTATSSNPPSSIWGATADGVSFTASIDPNTLQISGLPNYIAISLSAPPVTPSYGPPLISWNANLLGFFYTTQDGKDVYWNGGDAGGDYTVIVAQDDSVVAMHGSTTATGVYTSPGVFNFQGAAGTADIVAQDANGNPFPGELGPGITLLFGSNGPGHSILGPSQSSATLYTYRRPDGSWCVKYVNLFDGVYLVQDENGKYTAPPYKFQGTVGDTVVNAISGWPATNIYPQQLYINGIYCAMVSGSQYDSGAGFPRNGGVSYRASAYDLTVVLSWNWVDASTGFQGFVTGKYGQSSSFSGSWDGLSGFTNLTNGAIASVTAPTNVPTDGNPPQVSVNGSALQYNSLASTALANAGTPGDVYSGSLGQTLTIYQGTGAVSYVPSGTGATAITGTYNATTHQFSFGAGGNTVTIPGSDGSSSTAMITATDTDGHNLATPAGGASNGNGVTELAGGLDVQGNSFTLGSWVDSSSASIPGFLLSFTPPASGQPALVQFGSPISVADWVWSHAVTDGSTTHQTVMQLDSANRLSLFSPTNGTAPTIVLDPAGVSLINGLIQIAPQGDVLMGEFGN